MDDRFVDVYSRKTGRKHRVPAHFMENPRLAAPFRKTPKQRNTEAAPGSATPGTDVTTTTPANHPTTTEPPAAGEKE